MMFLVVLGLIGLAAIGATFYAIARDGYAPVRTRDAAFYRSTFDHAAFHAQASPLGSVPAPSADHSRWLEAPTLAADVHGAATATSAHPDTVHPDALQAETLHPDAVAAPRPDRAANAQPTTPDTKDATA